MRRPQLEMLKGGGQEAPCELCARGLFLGQGDDEAAKAGMLAVLAVLEGKPDGRIRVCGSHREDLASLRVETRPLLEEAKSSRKQRRASAAVVRRAHRMSLPRGARPQAAQSRPAPPKVGGGGIQF